MGHMFVTACTHGAHTYPALYIVHMVTTQLETSLGSDPKIYQSIKQIETGHTSLVQL